MKKPKVTKYKIKKSTAALILSLLSAVMLILTAVGIWLMRHYLAEPETVREFVGEHFFTGAALLLAVCAVQVLIALVPGELVEVASGYIFGMWGGTLLCWSGIMLGSIFTMLLVRRFGRPFAEVFQSTDKLNSLAFLSDRKKRNTLTAILYLIPGTPKDAITYLLGLTDMKLSTYVLLTGLARLPSIIMSTAGGDALGLGKLGVGIWIMMIGGAVSLCGYLVYLYIQGKNNK